MTITDALLTPNPYSRSGAQLAPVRALIMHWTAVPMQPARDVQRYFESRKNGKTGYGSAHYVIGLDGEIIRCIPEAEVAFHVGSTKLDPASGRIYTDWARAHFGDNQCDPATIGPNAVTLGVEMCPVDDAGTFTHATIISATELAADVCKRHELNPFQDIARHYDVVGWKDCPRYWVNVPAILEEFRAGVASLISKGGMP